MRFTHFLSVLNEVEDDSVSRTELKQWKLEFCRHLRSKIGLLCNDLFALGGNDYYAKQDLPASVQVHGEFKFSGTTFVFTANDPERLTQLQKITKKIDRLNDTLAKHTG